MKTIHRRKKEEVRELLNTVPAVVSDGFYKAVRDIQPKRSFLVHGRFDLPYRKNENGVEIIPLLDMCKEVAENFGG